MSIKSGAILGVFLRSSVALVLLGAVAGRADADIQWTWAFGSEVGTFRTDGSLDSSGRAPAGTYNILQFDVTQSVEITNVGATYSEIEPGSGFIWDGTQPTQWFRAGGAHTDGSTFMRQDSLYMYILTIGRYSLFENGTERLFDNVLAHGVASAWQDLGNALEGAFGNPALLGVGTLSPSRTVALTMKQALNGSSSTLIIGLSTINVPFGGGILVPSPDLILAGLPTSPQGTLNISAKVPADLPAGVSIFFQHWIIDPAGPSGFAASNAIQGTSE